MSRRTLVSVGLIAAVASVSVLVFLWQPWNSDERDQDVSDSPGMTLAGVIALVSREHTGCPDQPFLVLTADATYSGDGKWTVTYRDYSWTVNEADRSVRAIGEPLPCPGR